MKFRTTFLLACALALLGPRTAGAAPPHPWTLEGSGAITFGDRTDPSFGWWAGAGREVTSSVQLGVEAGRLRWVPLERRGAELTAQGIADDFASLARGGQELQHVSATLRLHGNRSGTNPALTLGVGAYRQTLRTPLDFPGMPKDGLVRGGWSIAFGGAGRGRIAPHLQFRFDYVDTQPSPSVYVSTGLGLRAAL